jgi:hypothetical protein
MWLVFFINVWTPLNISNCPRYALGTPYELRPSLHAERAGHSLRELYALRAP